jgi:homoserine kinase type II
VAVCVNDWCLVDPARDARVDEARVRALLSGYDSVRPVGAVEAQSWPVLLRAAALRFWLSRLHDFHLPRPGMLVHAHDPEHFRRILESRIETSAAWAH